MALSINDVIALASAGFSKNDIAAFMNLGTDQNAPPATPPAPSPAPVPAPAPITTPPAPAVPDYAAQLAALMAKIDVNGDGAHPLYKHLKQHAKGILGTEAIKWNFTKFLVSRDGQHIERYAPTTTPDELVKDIEGIL